MLVFIAAVTLALVVSFMCSIMESVLLSIRSSDVERLVSEGKPAGTLLQTFKRNIDAPIASILIVNTIAHTIGATVAGASYESAVNAESLWIFSVVFTIAVLLLSEIIPKTLGVAYAKQLAVPVAYAIKYLSFSLHPLVVVSEQLSKMLRGDAQNPVTSSEEIRLLAMMGRKEGAVAAQTAQLVIRATSISRVQVRDVMIPRKKVVCISSDSSVDEILAVMKSSGYSRLPVSDTSNLDDFSGILLAKEFLINLQQSEGDLDWHSLIREPLVISEQQTLPQAMKTFQDHRNHLAVVVDEYGSAGGIVTLEDVLEEIVGNIYDELDPVTETPIDACPDGSIDVLADTDMSAVFEHFGIEWQTSQGIKSVGGQITEFLQNIPKPGDIVELNGLQLSVSEAEPTHVVRVKIRKLETEAEANDENA